MAACGMIGHGHWQGMHECTGLRQARSGRSGYLPVFSDAGDSVATASIGSVLEGPSQWQVRHVRSSRTWGRCCGAFQRSVFSAAISVTPGSMFRSESVRAQSKLAEKFDHFPRGS